MNLKIVFIVMAMSLSLQGHSQQPPMKKMVVKNGTVFTGTIDDTPALRNIYICDGIITAVEPADAPVRPDYNDVDMIDAKGKFVMPGLIDAHVHLSLDQGKLLEEVQKPLLSLLEKELLAGVTTVRDMGGDGLILGLFARSANRDSIPSPDIFYSAFLAGRDYYNLYYFRDANSKEYIADEDLPWHQTIYDTTNVHDAILRAKASGATGIKIYAEISVDKVSELIKEAHKQGIKAWAHATVVPALPIDMIDAGVDVLSHSYLIPYQQLEGSENISFDYETMQTMNKDFPKLDLIFEKMKEKGTILDATVYLCTLEGGDPLSMEATIYTTRKAHDAGVKIAAGTDWMYDDEKDQANIHEEIITLVKKCGFTPKEALNSATIISAEAVGLVDRGAVETGKRADIIILEKDPMANIDNIKSVSTVIKRGNIYEVKKR